MFDNLFKSTCKLLKPLYIWFNNYKMGFAQFLIFLFILLIIYQIFDDLDVLPFDKEWDKGECDFESESDSDSDSDSDSESEYVIDGKIIEGAKNKKKKKKKKKGGKIKSKKQKKNDKKKKSRAKAEAKAAEEASICEPSLVPIIPPQAIPDTPLDENDPYLGQPYSYAKSIKTPQELGMSSKGTIKALGNDIEGIIQYISVLTTGDSKASKTKGALGDAYFFKTPSTCTASDTGKQVPRSIYFDHIPNSPGLNGLVPSMITGLDKFNPLGIMSAFTQSARPPCDKVTLKVVNANNVVGRVTNYVATSEIREIHPCNFVATGFNPVTGEKCPALLQKINKGKKGKKGKKGNKKKGKKKKGKKKKGKKKKGKAGFETMSDFWGMSDDDESTSGSESSDLESSESESESETESVVMESSLINEYCANIKEDMFTHVYFSSLGLVGVYVLYRLMMKK
jgi:hypothetical protein